MNNKSKMINKIIESAMMSFLALTTTHSAMAAEQLGISQNTQEKCYGIAKAGMNDCATAAQSCASSATKDRQSDAFIFLPSGTCQKIVGGVLKPQEEHKM
jgi:uncharacterized membrane protein